MLERFTKKSAYNNHGARVVAGQRVMQASSDIFLGWQRSDGIDGVTRDYYVRQLQDWKGSVDIESAIPAGMRAYGDLCGHTLARAHARSGDRIAIASYLGNNGEFEKRTDPLRRDLRRPERARLRGICPGLQERDGSRWSRASENELSRTGRCRWVQPRRQAVRSRRCVAQQQGRAETCDARAASIDSGRVAC